MAKYDNPLNELKVASPCSQDWNAMVGGDRRRYCGECKLHVYHLSGMTRTQAENLVQNAEGRRCVRLYKRADGRVSLQDCPVGWARARPRAAMFLTAAASLIFSFIGALGLMAFVNKTKDLTFKLPIPFATPTPERTMGVIAMPTPKKTASP